MSTRTSVLGTAFLASTLLMLAGGWLLYLISMPFMESLEFFFEHEVVAFDIDWVHTILFGVIGTNLFFVGGGIFWITWIISNDLMRSRGSNDWEDDSTEVDSDGTPDAVDAFLRQRSFPGRRDH